MPGSQQGHGVCQGRESHAAAVANRSRLLLLSASPRPRQGAVVIVVLHPGPSRWMRQTARTVSGHDDSDRSGNRCALPTPAATRALDVGGRADGLVAPLFPDAEPVDANRFRRC